MVSIVCWKCGKQLEELSRKISFREMCPHCHAYLHCCKNCLHYKPGLPNDCAIPGTDPIRDRETLNFCDEFSFLGKKAPHTSSSASEDILKRLFKDPGS